jgi:D-xylose transport system permease protein
MNRLLALTLSIPLLWVTFHFLSDGAILTPGNLVNLFKYMAMVGLLSTGMTLVIAAGYIDLSVGSALGLLAAVSAWGLQQGWGLPFAILLSLAAALSLGLFQGGLVAYAKVPAFIVTLGGLLACMGLKQWLANPVIPIREPLWIGLGQGHATGLLAALLWATGLAAIWIPFWVKSHRREKSVPIWKQAWPSVTWTLLLSGLFWVCLLDRGVPASVLLMLAAAGATHFIAERTRFGRYVFALGSNPEAARYSGLPLRGITLGVFVWMAGMALLSGWSAAGQLKASAADIGDYQELYAIAACVLGGTSLRGGSGNVWHSLLGALLMATILNGMEQMGLPSPVQKVILGGMLVAAVALETGGKKTA